MEVKQKKLPKSQIELEFELTAEEFQEHFEHALERLRSHVKVDGFRPGQAPAKMVEDKLKPEMLLMEAGDHAVQHVYSDYVKENNLEPVGQPEVSIIKMPARHNLRSNLGGAKGEPAQNPSDIVAGDNFVFKVVITVLPEVELPDYKEIAKAVKGKEISVTEEEVQDSLNYLQKIRAKFTLKNEPAEKKDFVEISYQNKDINEGKPVDDQFILGEAGFVKGFEDQIIGMRANEEKTFVLDWQPARHNAEALGGEKKVPAENPSPARNASHSDAGGDNQAGKTFKVKVKSVQKTELPEINDEFAKQLGAFDTLVALKDSIKQGIEMEKTEQEKQRKRGEILEKIAEKTKIELPDAMIEYEKKNLMEDLKNKIAETTKASFEDYLAAIKKTEEEIKETFQKEAEKRLRGFLVLRELGKKENIEVTDAEVEEEANKNLKIEKLKNLKEVDINQLKEYTKGVIQNEKIFQLLENFSH